MLREILVYGRLAKFLGRRVFRAEVATAAEAVRFLVANFPQLERHMADQHYRVSIAGYDLSMDEIHDPAGQQQIKIVPVLAGAGGGIGRILLGAALIAGAFFTGGATIGLLGLAAPIAVSTVLSGIGISLVLGGVAQLLSPVPMDLSGADGNDDPRKSYSFSGVQQTSRQGVPVPIVYGETLVGSVVISAGVETERVD
jgi:predicted phage tail protein